MARLSLIIFAIALVSMQCALSLNTDGDGDLSSQQTETGQNGDSNPVTGNEQAQPADDAPVVTSQPTPSSTEPTTTTTTTWTTTTAAPIKINNSSTLQVLVTNQTTQPTSTTTKKPQAAASVVDSNNNKVANALASAPASTANSAFVCMAAIVGLCASFVLPLLREQ